MPRRLLIIATIGAFLAATAIYLQPIANKALHLGYLTSLAILWTGLVILFWKAKVVCALIAVGIVTQVGMLFLPALSPTSPEKLRDAYVANLRDLEDTRYVWGGEKPRGIDCSGLCRFAFRTALREGGNPIAFLEQWWHDASARALSQGHREYTIPLTTGGTIQEMPYDDLLPGDLAVTSSGSHILAYLGDDLWIQADPTLGKVAILNGRTADNNWFRIPVTTHRWAALAE